MGELRHRQVNAVLDIGTFPTVGGLRQSFLNHINFLDDIFVRHQKHLLDAFFLCQTHPANTSKIFLARVCIVVQLDR